MKVDLTKGGVQALPPSLVHLRMACMSAAQRLPNVTRVLSAVKPARALVFASSAEELQAALAFLKGKV